jgi:hypothetical protein
VDEDCGRSRVRRVMCLDLRAVCVIGQWAMSCAEGRSVSFVKDKAGFVTVVIFLCGYALLWLTGVTSTGHLVDNLVAGYLLAWGLYVFLSDVPRKEIRA